MGLAPAGPTQALFKNAPGVFVGAARSRARGLSNWLRQLSNPGRGFSSPPGGCHMREKSPYLRTGSHLKYGGEGGLTRFARPCGAARSRARGLSNWLRQLSNPGRGFSSPRWVPHAKKKPVLAYELFLKYGGEGGIRTPDTLPYTHFPGVLLQPLGHLTILSCCSPWVGNGALL